MTTSPSISPRHRLDRALSDLSLIALHELDSLTGHWAAIRERLVLAGKARSTGELLQDQMDLLPQTLARLRHDQRSRRELLRGMAQHWRGLPERD